MPHSPCATRRTILASALAGGALLAAPAARAAKWHNLDITGYVPDLHFDMMDANTGKPISAKAFQGKFTLLYFGYTQCPDVCPLTLQRVAEVFKKMGKTSDEFRFLFVTVDPTRDTLPVLKQYVEAFSPKFVGLRGDPDEIARIARRYRIAYSVSPATKTHPYTVTHSSAIYVFDRDGQPKLLLGSLATTSPDIKGTVEDLDRLAHEPKPGLLSRVMAEF